MVNVLNDCKGIRVETTIGVGGQNCSILRQRRWRAVKSKLEKLALKHEHFECLSFLKEVLQPFAEAKHCLEDDQYFTISLLVHVMKWLYDDELHLIFAKSRNCMLKAKIVGEMSHNFIAHWGDDIVFSSDLVCGALHCQVGLPAYTYWASLLDPRAKCSTLQVLAEVKDEANMGGYYRRHCGVG